MDGLECSEVMRSTLERTTRIDSEFYQKESFKVFDLINGFPHKPLTEFVDVSDGNHMTISDKFSDEGIPYYRGQDIKSFFIENSSPVCIDENSFSSPYMKRSHLKKGDVLLSIVGTIGSLALVYSDKKATCSCKLAILRPKADTKAEVIATFLSGRYGQNQIKKYTRGAVQMGLILEDMEQLIVPAFRDAFKKCIQDLVVMAFEKDNQSKQTYFHAEQLLLSKLGMANFTPSTEAVSIKPLSVSFLSSGRLDAEYYQPKYEQLFQLMACLECKPLGKIVTTKKSIEPGSDYYGDEGIPFVRVSDITKYGISTPEIKLPVDVVPNVRSLYPQKDTILLSKDGSVGIAYKVEQDLAAITSGALLHLIVKDKEAVLPDYLALVLNSQVVRLQGERDVSGAIIQHWKPSEIEKVLIPILDKSIQKELSDRIQQAFTLRHQSEQQLETAKQAVEIAIEQGEDTAITWLKEKGVEG